MSAQNGRRWIVVRETINSKSASGPFGELVSAAEEITLRVIDDFQMDARNAPFVRYTVIELEPETGW